ncbi:MAG: sugar phosphate isomerase/epimerase family protein [Desulfococcaceae bacterium]
MLALSTSWISLSIDGGEALLSSLDRPGVVGLELEYRMSRQLLAGFAPLLTSHRLRVESVHNYFPIPPGMEETGGGGDLFDLAALDSEARRTAVHWTSETIRRAADLGASAVVLHCGRVDMDARRRTLYGPFRETGTVSAEIRERLLERLAERDRRKPPHLAALRRSLEALAEPARKAGVVLGLENRNHYHELPGFEDFAPLFAQLEGAPIGYWHDTGHAHAQQALGIIPPEEPLASFADRLVGVHLHDARGLTDHLPPGDGEIDFESVRRRLGRKTLRVIELRPGTSSHDVDRAIQTLRTLGFAEP